uniref:Secreted protein n=1 Tax=Trichogramma kaykai TaxID=54128 RepID=A0ABD2XD77_9HYME
MIAKAIIILAVLNIERYSNCGISVFVCACMCIRQRIHSSNRCSLILSGDFCRCNRSRCRCRISVKHITRSRQRIFFIVISTNLPANLYGSYSRKKRISLSFFLHFLPVKANLRRRYRGTTCNNAPQCIHIYQVADGASGFPGTRNF